MHLHPLSPGSGRFILFVDCVPEGDWRPGLRWSRRQFLEAGGAAGLAAAGGCLFPGCGTPRGTLRPGEPFAANPSPVDRLLPLAVLAPSSHNTQPWRVHVDDAGRWSVGADASRQLRVVDPDARELVLSVGAFAETLATAAGAIGFEPRISVPGQTRTAPDLLAVELSPTAPGDPGCLARIRSRCTVREGQLPDPLGAIDVRALLAAAGPRSAWFASGSTEGRWLRESTVAAFAQQSRNDLAQRELSRWLRFSDADVAARRDGLTLAALGVDGLEGFWARTFMEPDDAMKQGFRERGIESAARQAGSCAGWLVLTSDGDSVPSLVDAGRRFVRTGLGLRERGLGAHPMTQVLEERPWREQVARELRLPGSVQFLVRIGRVRDYPDPVSPRRPVSSFLS